MLEKLGAIHPLLPPAAGLLALFAVAIIIDLIAKQVMVRTVRAFAKRSSATWDDALALGVVDLGGRFWLEWDVSFPRIELGGLAVENIRHFFYSFADAARITLHIRVNGQNTHHMAEAVFKAVGMALEEGLKPWTGSRIRSTKGVLV